MMKDLWARLEQAASGTYEAWRQAVLCTVNNDRAEGRMVVLRGADADQARLVTFTDLRSDKVQQCAGGVTMLFWDAALQCQLRFTGKISVETTGPHVEAHWRQVGEHSRENYRGALAPGTQVESSDACASLEPQDGRDNFAVVTIQVDRADALWLREKRRMQAHRQRGKWKTSWVQV